MTDHDPSAPLTIRVWDPFVRLFHWSLVASVTICLVLEAGDSLHRMAGYVAGGLVLFRLGWGVVGSRHARFSNFVTGPGAILRYLRSLLTGRPEAHHGHNPAGGAMIVVLLATLALSAGSGALLATDTFWGSDWLEEAHESISEFLYILIPLHLLGVAVSSVLHKENLVRAMITGDKKA
jgi:cytochrome b